MYSYTSGLGYEARMDIILGDCRDVQNHINETYLQKIGFVDVTNNLKK